MLKGREYEENAADTDAKLRSTEYLELSAPNCLHRKRRKFTWRDATTPGSSDAGRKEEVDQPGGGASLRGLGE